MVISYLVLNHHSRVITTDYMAMWLFDWIVDEYDIASLKITMPHLLLNILRCSHQVLIIFRLDCGQFICIEALRAGKTDCKRRCVERVV